MKRFEREFFQDDWVQVRAEIKVKQEGIAGMRPSSDLLNPPSRFS
jgi:hypothetical protein